MTLNLLTLRISLTIPLSSLANIPLNVFDDLSQSKDNFHVNIFFFFFFTFMLLMLLMMKWWTFGPLLLFWPTAGQSVAGCEMKVEPPELLCYPPISVEISQIQSWRDKDRCPQKKENKFHFYMSWVMQQRKDIIVNSSVPAASGTQKGTANPFKNLIGCCCILSFQHRQKLLNLFGSETKSGRSFSFFSRHLLSFSANINPNFNI